MRSKLLLLGIVFTTFSQFVNAQFTLDGEFRPRLEFRNGFGTLITENSDPGLGVATRARLNAEYKTDAYKFYLSLQDVFVWGENRQILPNDANNSFAIFQAWAEINLGAGFSTKLGRQVLSYDDQRILGGLDWAQQGRNHDAGLLKYKKGTFKADFALAFNQDNTTPGGFQSEGTAFTTTGFFTYKTMQMLHVHKSWTDFSGSVLLMNNGFQKGATVGGVFQPQDGNNNLQTFGTHLKYKKNKFSVAANAYLQTGERQGDVEVSGAYLLGLDVSYKASPKIGVGAGLEIISGRTDDTAAFFPLYGTNHKFNGFMDYFYVGNHANSIGLFDIHASANFKLDEKSSLMLKVLNFRGEQELASGEKSLGTEVDLVYKRKFKGFAVVAGYSHMFESDGMYELKGIAEADVAGTQNWAWAMLVLKPKFLNGTK